MNKLNAFLSVNNQTTLLTLLGVLIAFVVLLTILGIVFIIALRKRRPIVKVVMTPEVKQCEEENAAATETLAVPEMAATAPTAQPTEAAVPETATRPSAAATAPQPIYPPVYAANTAANPVKVIDKQVDEGYLVPVYMITAYENVYYSFSPYEISNQPHEKYSAIKNNIQAYERVKERTSNKREGYRVGRASVSGSRQNYVKQKKGIRIATVKRKSV